MRVPLLARGASAASSTTARLAMISILVALACFGGVASCDCPRPVGPPVNRTNVFPATPPPADRAVAIVGDLQRTLWQERLLFGREQNDEARARLMADLVAERPGALIVSGDLVDWGASKSSWQRLDELLAPLHAMSIPVLPVLGNHDHYGCNCGTVEGATERFIALTENQGKPWYTKKWGALGFVELDSNRQKLGADWDREIADLPGIVASLENDDSVRAVVWVFHHAPYTNSALGGDECVRNAFVPIFCASSKSILVVTGHVHGYEHFVRGALDGCGGRDRHFVVSGGGGGPRRDDYRSSAETGLVDRAPTHAPGPFHYLWLTQSARALEIRVRGFYANEPASVLDEFEIPFSSEVGSPMPRIDLNIDLGELENEPEELYALATVVNLACGGHAGDDLSMRRGLALARSASARIAAHPSYPDRAGFGRVSMAMPATALYETIVDQCSTLAELARELGTRVSAVKAHGALYHDATRNEAVRAPLLDAIVATFPDGVIIVGPNEAVLETAARARGLGYAREAFADRAYGNDGRLVPRGIPGAVLDDPDVCAAQALLFARRGDTDTVCVHGDHPNAVAIARAVRRAVISP